MSDPKFLSFVNEHPSMRRLLVGTILATWLLPATAPPAQAFVDPVTIGVGLSVAQSILLLGNRGPDLNLQSTLAALEMLRAVHQRLDGIEQGITQVHLELVVDIPEQVRRDMDRDRDHRTGRDNEGARRGHPRPAECAAIREAHRFMGQGLLQIKADLHRLRLDLQNDINSLFDRSDFVAPYITAAMTIEIAAAQSRRGQRRRDQSPPAALRCSACDEMQDWDRRGSFRRLTCCHGEGTG